MISSEQIRAARALLRWEQEKLAAASGVSISSLEKLEMQPGVLSADARTVEAVEKAFTHAGVVFLDDGALVAGGPGVRLAASQQPVDDLKETVQYPEFLSPDASTGSGG